MKILSTRLRPPQERQFDLAADRDLLNQIVEDMKANAGAHAPSQAWGLEIGGHDGDDFFKRSLEGTLPATDSNRSDEELFRTRYANMSQMMDPWVGCTGMLELRERLDSRYLEFLRKIDVVGFLPEYFDDNGEPNKRGLKLINADIGSIHDLSLICCFAGFESKESMRLLEVGGGYGRLAETFLHVFGDQVRFVLVDAVPASLMYQYLYLKRALPEFEIGHYHLGHPFDLDRYAVYIAPSWRIEELSPPGYDVALNVQSMEEMDQHHVDYYLQLFNDMLADQGIVYLSNARDYIFRGEWNFPESWRREFMARTPRAWTPDFPTEVFRKTSAGELRTRAGLAIEAAYELMVERKGP